MIKTSPIILNFYDNEIVPRIQKKLGCSFIEALKSFIYSDTYKMLEDESYGMTQFGQSAIYDIWDCENSTGDVKNSIYLQG